MNVPKQLFVRRPCSSSDDHSRERKQNESPTKKIEKFARKPQTVTYFPPYFRSPMKTSNEAQDINEDKERFSQWKKLTKMNEDSQSEAQSIQLDKTQTHDKKTNQDLSSNIEEVEQQTEQFSIFAHLRASEQSLKPQNSEFVESNPNDSSNLKSIDHEEEEYLTSFNQGFFNKDQKQTIKQQQKFLQEYSPGQKSAYNCTDEQRKKYCSFNLKELQDARKKEFDRRKSSQIFASIHPETIPNSLENQFMLQSTITYNFAAEQSEKPTYSQKPSLAQKQSTYSLSYTKSYADPGNGLEQFSNLTKIKEQAQFFEEDHSTISANNQSKFSNQPNFGDSSRQSDSVQKSQNLSVKYQIKPFVKPAQTQIKHQYIRAAYVIEWKKEQTKEESNLPTGRSLLNCPKHVLQRMGLDKKLREHLLPIIQRAQQKQQMGQKLKEQVIVQNTQHTNESIFQNNTLQCSISNNLPNSTQHQFEESIPCVSNAEHNVNDENYQQAQISRSGTQRSNVSEPFEDQYEIQTSRSQYTLTQLDPSENLESQQSKEQHEIRSNFLHQNGYQSSESSSSQVSLKNSSCRPSYKNKQHVKSKAKPLRQKNNYYQAENNLQFTSKRAIQNKDQFYWRHMNKLDSLIVQILQMKKSFQNHYLSEINHQRNQCEKRTSEILSQLNQINEKLEKKENLETKKKQRQMSNNRDFKFIQSNYSNDHKKISEDKYSHQKFHNDPDFYQRKNNKNTYPSIQSSKSKSQKGQNNKLIHQSLVQYENQPEQNNQKQITLPSPLTVENHIRLPSRRHHSLSAASYKNQIQQQLKKIDTRQTVILEEQSDGSSQKNSNPASKQSCKQKNPHQKSNPFRQQEFPLKFSPNHSRKSTEKQKRHYSQTLIQLMQDSREKINRRAYDENLLEEVEQNFIKNRQIQRQKIRKIIREKMKKQARNSYDNYFPDDGYESSDTFDDINESSEKGPQNCEGLKTLPNIQKVIESKKQFKHARKIIQNSIEKSKFSNSAENCSEQDNLNQVRDQLKQYSQIVQQKNLIHKQDIYNQIDSKIKDSFWNSNMEISMKKSSLSSKKTKKIENQSLKGSSSAQSKIISSISQPITQILKAKRQNELNQTFRTPQNQIQTPEPRTFHDNFFINRVSSENSDQQNKISKGLFNDQGTFITSSQQNGTDHDIDFRNSDLRTLMKTKSPQFTQTFQQKISNSLENNIQSKNSQDLQSCLPCPFSLQKQKSDKKLSNEKNQSVLLEQKILKLSNHRESGNTKQIYEQYLSTQTMKAERQMKIQNTQKTSINGLKKLKQRLLQKNSISLTSPLLENQLKTAKSFSQSKINNSNDHIASVNLVNLTESGKLSEKDSQCVQCSQIHEYDTGNKKSDVLQAKKYQFSAKQSDNCIGSSKFSECVTQKDQISQNKRQNQVILQGPNKQLVYNTKKNPIVIKLQNLKNSPIPSLSSKLPAISFNKKLKQGHLKAETRLIDEKTQFCKSPMLKKDYYRIQPLTQRKEVQGEKNQQKQVYLQNLPQNSGYQFNQSIEILPNSGAFNSIYYDKQNQQIYKYKWFKFK